ncbi:GrpB family protein [Chryseobacterium sp. CFS15]|uniref:GrpB family protein n=1 Tax=Chryseobacterium sp. CFS15 TaxID=2986946 RepID=UPI002809474F|nr:GrpB family protein [Chryseobacterium sp. CFS15]MDQ8141439.1 GrpB family protein [Chryseobacterium sp. CFS15]
MKIIIEPYSDDWKLKYEKIEYILKHYLDGLYSDIQHVGSTSVKGLAAKPIIDIDIIIQNLTVRDFITEKLTAMGYCYQGTLGIPGRYSFSQKHPFAPFNKESKEAITHNLYVCESGCVALENHLQFRNYLRNHPTAVKEYADLKYRIAASTEDINEYVAQKTAFITTILKECGLPSSAIQAIRDSNKLV